MVSLARPFLADSHFAAKARSGRPEAINTCIACNQACLDHYFVGKVATCLVNPRAGHETEIVVSPASEPKRIAVVGAGAAGLAAAVTAAERGHAVTLYEAAGEIGGQLNLARAVPAKEEFNETLRYFRTCIADLGIDLKLGRKAEADDIAGGADAAILATGVVPRTGILDGEDHPKVATYADILSGRIPAGARVAIVGAGGMGFDIAVYLPQAGSTAHIDPAAFRAHWGIGGEPERRRPAREITMLQRTPGPMGRTLGRTTGWVHKLELHHAGVRQVSGATYRGVDDAGLHFSVDGEDRLLDVDTVILCAGQVSVDGLSEELETTGLLVRVIGGAKLAAELDAKRAIEEGMKAAIAV
jgi:2,4-dienoyl-CoA reductase (NADPH2)